MKHIKNNQGMVTTIVTVAAAIFLGIVFYFGLKESRNLPLAGIKASPNPMEQSQVRSVPKGIVSGVLTAKSLDSQSGQVLESARVFSPTDPSIFLVVNLNKPPVGSRIEYIRFFNGLYLDHKSVEITEENLPHIFFDFSLEEGLVRIPGIYRVRIYSNGVLEKKLNYEIEN